MPFANVIKDQGAVYFVTFTVHQWADVFTKQLYVDVLIDNLNYCINHKGLQVFCWVVMSNHCHMIVRSENNLSDVIRDFKKYTAKTIYKAIENNNRESRKEWLLNVLSYEGRIWFWKEGYHGEEIFTRSFFETKCNYIHQTPVRAGIVEKEEEYLRSSAGEFYGIRKSKVQLSDY